MLIIPAIDLKEGAVVRLVQGRFNKKIYSRDPVKTARHWIKQGAEMLHIVDLDGAIGGKPKNLGAVKEILKSVSVPVQFGGGIREITTIEKLLKLGVRRVVLGTKAISDKAFLKKAFLRFNSRVIVSIDARDNRLLIKGWRTGYKNADVLGYARFLKEMGFKQLIYTDISKDGTLEGPNLKAIKGLLKKTSLEIIASGGISSLKDISGLKKLEKQGLVGMIIGKALYEGRFSLTEALKLC